MINYLPLLLENSSGLVSYLTKTEKNGEISRNFYPFLFYCELGVSTVPEKVNLLGDCLKENSLLISLILNHSTEPVDF